MGGEDKAKQISNPFSTGGGGNNFEVQVQASFVALMLAEGFSPCLPCQPIRKIKLQGRYAGYNTDDLIVFTANEDGSKEHKLLGQIKHTVSIIESDATFGAVIQAAWRDFSNTSIFTKGKDVIALITGPLSATDIADVRTLLEWARTSESAQEFLTKVGTANFSSGTKRSKLRAFRTHLVAANGKTITDEELFLFLRHFHLLGYDLDIKSGVMHAILHSLIGQYSQANAQSLWRQIVEEVMSADQNAGTISRNSMPEELRNAFAARVIHKIPADISSAVSPPTLIDWRTSEFASVLTVALLVGSWDEKSEVDMAIVRQLVQGSFGAWQSKIRQVLQLPDSPVSLRNGVWAARKRDELWKTLGSCVFDSHLETLHKCATTVLKEKDPQFELESEERYAAAIHGKVLKHSSHIRKGLADALALLGSRPEPLINCSSEKRDATAAIAIREIFDGADWVHWGSVNDVLPLLAEAAPNEFLSALEQGLSATQCPFDALFAQEVGSIIGKNHLTGLLWALETIAWDEKYLVRAAVSLGKLAERDPGGQWGNRPSHSLTTIFLPWFPQTTASIDKRKVAIQTLQRESPESAWKLLLSLLPNQVNSSGGSRKPSWRRMLPDEWKDSVSQKDYLDQVSIYAEMAIKVAVSDASALKQLIKHLGHLPEPALEMILNHLLSDDIATMPEEERLAIWTSLTELARKYRRFADAEWALPSDIVSHIESAAATIAPKKPSNLHRNLFCGRDWDLYEETGDWQEQERRLDERRITAVKEILEGGSISDVVKFAESVESPRQVGLTLGLLGKHGLDDRVLPEMLSAEDDKHREFAIGFVCGSFRDGQWAWVDSLNVTSWLKAEIGKLLVCMPFSSETWDRVDSLLGGSAADYWKRAEVNPYQAEGDLCIAIDNLLANGRPQAAIDCLARIVHDKQTLDKNRAVKALLLAASSSESRHSLNKYHVTSIIQALQDDPEINEDELLKVEWAYLPLLSRHDRAAPKLLESRLASDPEAFCRMIRIVFRSDKEDVSDAEPSEEQQAIAENAYRLLRQWRTPPGTLLSGSYSGDDFRQWMEAVIESSTESGHLEVALLQAGAVLIHCPPDPDGLWMHRAVAEVLNREDIEELRSGYRTAVYNSRGAHFVDPTGKPEMKLARKYEEQANQVENAGYHRFAATLRNLAKGYESEAKQIVSRHQLEADKGSDE